MIRQVSILLALTLLAAAGTHYFHPKAPAWYLDGPVGGVTEDELSPAEVRKRWGDGVLWIDARPREQYEMGHIPGALLINEQERDRLMFDAFEKLQSNTLPVVVYCSSQSCDASRRMKEFLKERVAVSEIFLLKGGWKAWMETGGDQRRGELP